MTSNKKDKTIHSQGGKVMNDVSWQQCERGTMKRNLFT